VTRAVVVVLISFACSARERDTGPCRCTPSNASRVRSVDEAAPFDGAALLAKLREHRNLVLAQRNPRDIKVFDDELRFAIANFCEPCNDWVSDRMTIEELYPLARLDDATRAVCLGLVLRDGTTLYGDARPQNCR
jgi:hypothetical protein